MRNRKFVFSLLKSTWLKNYKSDNWDSLINKFSGRRLFAYNYFNLLNGNMSALRNKNSKWLLENIINYSSSKEDKNFIPVLKRIVADTAIDESMRQRTAEVLEMPWVENNSLIGTRTPQTSEILKLLKVNSIESKRHAICMIGKFRMTDMLQEVAECFNINGLEIDAASVILSFRSEAGNELKQIYFKSSGNINTGKAILRILGRTGVQEDINFLFERLFSNSKEIKEVSLDCLVENNFIVPEEERGRINQLLCEVMGTIVWILSAQICAEKSGLGFLNRLLDKELVQWKKFLFGILFITYESGEVDNIAKEPIDDETDISNFFPELLDLIFNHPKKPYLWFFSRTLSDEQKVRRLQKFFPVVIPDYKDLVEDILNHDYNQINIWTKACTLRNVRTIGDENFGESVVALMFSPEEILREEAAKLLARTDMELYQSVSQRISTLTKTRLDKIVRNEAPEMELLLDKTIFLSYLFPEIPEDKLMFLSREMKYMKNFPQEFRLYPGGMILWALRPGLTRPDTVKIFLDDTVKFDRINISNDDSFLYLLSLRTVEEFHYLFPEHSFAFMKYIDDNEEPGSSC